MSMYNHGKRKYTVHEEIYIANHYIDLISQYASHVKQYQQPIIDHILILSLKY